MKGVLYKFNPDSTCTEEQARASREGMLMQKLELGERPTIDELESLFRELWNHDAYRYGIVRRAGWLYDFKPYFRRYLVNERHSGWREVWAYSKTAVRRLNIAPSGILEIVEIPKRGRAA